MDKWPSHLIWACWVSHSKTKDTPFVPLTPAITASTSRKAFHKILRRACGNLYPFSQWSFCKAHVLVLDEDLACSCHSYSSQRCSVGLRSGLCVGHLCSLIPHSSNSIFYGPGFVYLNAIILEGCPHLLHYIAMSQPGRWTEITTVCALISKYGILSILHLFQLCI